MEVLDAPVQLLVPDEVMVTIMALLEPRDVAKCCMVCKQWRRLGEVRSLFLFTLTRRSDASVFSHEAASVSRDAARLPSTFLCNSLTPSPALAFGLGITPEHQCRRRYSKCLWRCY